MTIASIRGVDVVYWNPRRVRLPSPFSTLSFGRRVNNFGDIAGPQIVDFLAPRRSASVGRHPRLLSLGSIIHFARENDVVWGSGLNGKVSLSEHRYQTLDIRLVRGPYTQRFLERRGIPCPMVFGDPGILIPEILFPHLSRPSRLVRKVALIPNLNDSRMFNQHPDFVDPRSSLYRIVSTIATSEVVIGSSLHAMVLADSLGVPRVLMTSQSEDPLKYRDYCAGLDLEWQEPAGSLQEALTAASQISRSYESPVLGEAKSRVKSSFPTDLWLSRSSAIV